MYREQTNTNPIAKSKKFTENDFTDWLISAADEIRKKLKLTESNFRFLGRAHNSRGRRHYIYAILDEVEQVALAMKLSHDTLGEAPSDIPDDELSRRLTRNTFSVIQREQALHIRRLTEMLVDLINFSKTNADVYYDHFLLYQELQEHQQRRYDFKQYFNCENLNTQSTIDLTMRSISNGEARLELSKCWYLAGANPKPGGKAKLETFMNRFDNALSLATRGERLMLGFYYGRAYREPSQSIHLNIGGLSSHMSFERLLFGRNQIWLLAVQCLNRCRQLLKLRTRKGVAAQLARAMDMAMMKEFYNDYTQPKIMKGDFVSVFDSLCEVGGVRKSQFGYKAFTITYLTRPPIEGHTEDCYPAIYVKKQIDAQELRNGVLNLLTVDGLRPKLDNRHLRKALRRSALQMWNEWVIAHRSHSPKINSSSVSQE